jgi:hypothetical protein
MYKPTRHKWISISISIWVYQGLLEALMLRIAKYLIVLSLIPQLGQSQGLWGSDSGYSYPSANDTAVRFQRIDMQQKLNSGYYDRLGDSTTTVMNDHSVGEVTVTVADGASSSVDIRSGPDSGTNSYSVGAVNTTTVTSYGTNNQIEIDAAADSTGCQDGSITMMVPTGGSELNIADGEGFMNSVSSASVTSSEAGCG